MDVMFLVVIAPVFSLVMIGCVAIIADEWTCGGLSTRYGLDDAR